MVKITKKYIKKANSTKLYPYMAKKSEKLKTWKFFKKSRNAYRHAGKNGIVRYRGK